MPVTLTYGHGVPTSDRLSDEKKGFDNPPEIIDGDGDGDGTSVFILEQCLPCVTFGMVNIWRDVEAMAKTLTVDLMQSKTKTQDGIVNLCSLTAVVGGCG